jgi:hypothetical protein
MGQLERDPAGQGPVGKVQLGRDQLFTRDRHASDRNFLMSISISSLPR